MEMFLKRTCKLMFKFDVCFRSYQLRLKRLKPRLYAQFAPWCKFTPGSKLHPGVNLHPLMLRSYATKFCSYVIEFAL